MPCFSADVIFAPSPTSKITLVCNQCSAAESNPEELLLNHVSSLELP